MRRQLDDVHRQLDNAKEIVDLYRAQGRVPQDQVRYDLEILQVQYAQLSIALEESLASTSFHSHGPSPTSHGIASPGVDPLGPHSATLRGSPCQDRRRSPSHDRSRARDAHSSHHRFSSRSDERYDQRVVYSDAPAHRRRPRSRESHPSRHLDFTSKSPSPTIRHRENVSLLMCHSRDDPPPGGRRLGGPSRLLRGASPLGGPSRLLRGASPHGGPLRLLRGASPHGGPRLLLRGASPHGGPRLLLRGVSPHGGPRLLLRGASPHG